MTRPDPEAWRGLEAGAAVPAAGALLPWLAAQAAIVRREPLTSGGPGNLAAAAAMSRRGLALRGWKTPLTFSGLPLAHDAAALRGLLSASAAPFAVFKGVPAGGPFWHMLVEAFGPRVAILTAWERAVLAPDTDYEAWFEAAFERKRRKEFRRLRARLGEQGDLHSLELPRGGDPSGWVDELLKLEASGWKGKRGTALAANGEAAAALKTALKELAIRNAVRFWKITLDGRPIAMMFALIHRDQGWLGKIAYDESFAKYSPGVLLVLDATESLHREGGLALVDSCAVPDHPMINHIWRGRIAMADIAVASPGTSPALFGAFVAWERAKLKGRAWLRDVYYLTMKRRRS